MPIAARSGLPMVWTTTPAACGAVLWGFRPPWWALALGRRPLLAKAKPLDHQKAEGLMPRGARGWDADLIHLKGRALADPRQEPASPTPFVGSPGPSGR